MNEKYVDDNYIVDFKIQSDYGINDEITLPLTLVQDLEEHMNVFEGVVKSPLKNMISNALHVYMDYINGDLVRFDGVKQFIDECAERHMQEMVVD